MTYASNVRRRLVILAACLLLAGVAGMRALAAAQNASSQAPGAANEFYDSHFHLTNYVQQGITPREFLQIMGTRVGRSTLFGIPLQQQWSYAQLGRLRADLLPAQRRAALLLLVHRRLHRQRLPSADARPSRRASIR